MRGLAQTRAGLQPAGVRAARGAARDDVGRRAAARLQLCLLGHLLEPFFPKLPASLATVLLQLQPLCEAWFFVYLLMMTSQRSALKINLQILCPFFPRLNITHFCK